MGPGSVLTTEVEVATGDSNVPVGEESSAEIEAMQSNNTETKVTDDRI